MIRWSPGMTPVETFATIGLILLVVAFILLLLEGCAPAPSNLCAAVRSGGLIQSGENPVAFDVIVGREVVLRGVPAAQIMECK